MRGLFDTDGSLYLEKKSTGPYPRIQIKTVSPPLARDIKELLTKLNFKFGYWIEKGEKITWSDRYVFVIRGYDQTKKWMKEIGSNNPKHVNKLKNIAIIW